MIYTILPSQFPPLLQEINDPPEKLFIRGEYPDVSTHLFLAVVGSRKYSAYGKEVVKTLIRGLSGYPVVIVSGLALGIDALAHTSALECGLKTIAIPGSGLGEKVIYPRSHTRLAEKIVQSGGCLLSPFEEDFRATPWSFPARNRIMAGLSHAVLVIEAEMKSGTLITARLAMEYNRDVSAVPGPITSRTSAGPHHLIQNGATPITCAEDIIEMLGLEIRTGDEKTHSHLSGLEEKIVLLLKQETLSRDEVIEKLGVATHEATVALSSLEIKGIIKEQLGVITLC